ncbi:hypothetical protein BH09MYX1_BH09MYX1_37310 [soil metagenome]
MGPFSRLWVASVALAGMAVLQCGSDEPLTGTKLEPPDISGGGCDASKTPDQGGCDVSDAAGIFVSTASGADTNPGTKAAPFKTVQAGVNAAKKDALRRNIYVCEGTYDEQLLLDEAAEGLALHGGFACADWAYKEMKVVLAPSKAGYVVRVAGISGVIETFELRAKDGDVPGASSVAVFVEAAPGMTFRRAKIVAGNGAKGADGLANAPFATAAQKGNAPTSSVAPGAELTCTCPNGTTTGGAGGGGNKLPPPAIPPTPGKPVIAGAPANAGQPYTSCGGGGAPGGYDGAGGLPADVVRGATAIGTISSQGWVPGAGSSGAVGGVAQGGAGAYGMFDAHVSSGGGCGGCGGKGGAPGGGGGASIGIVAINSTVRIQTSTVTTSDGGDGGKGGDGQSGQAGGIGGDELVGWSFCRGGTGGKGGDGSGGGGGAGGSSLGIVVLGADPRALLVDKETKFTIGAFKPGGPGGGPKGASGGYGIDGFAASILGTK